MQIDKLIKDVITIMDYPGISKASVIGHDWGAVLGWYVAIEHPERVNRYIALSDSGLKIKHGRAD